MVNTLTASALKGSALTAHGMSMIQLKGVVIVSMIEPLVVIMAGGAGSGLKHITGEDRPKCMISFGGRSLLRMCIERYTESGFNEFLVLGRTGENFKILTHHLNEIAEASKDSISIETRWEDKPLGKGGALLESGIDRDFFLTYPDDIILESNHAGKMHELFIGKDALGVVACSNKFEVRWGIIEAEDGELVTIFDEKPFFLSKISVGSYLFKAEVIGMLRYLVKETEPPIDLEGILLPYLVSTSRLYAHVIPYESWYPINDEKDLKRAASYLGEYTL